MQFLSFFLILSLHYRIFFFPKLSFSEIFPAVSVSAFLERELSGRSFTNRKHPMAAPSLWLWNLDTVLLLAVCTMRCVWPWPYWAKKLPPAWMRINWQMGEGWMLWKIKPKSAKEQRKTSIFKAWIVLNWKKIGMSLYPESTALIIYPLREIRRLYEELTCQDFSANFWILSLSFQQSLDLLLWFPLNRFSIFSHPPAVLLQNLLGLNDWPLDLVRPSIPIPADDA